MPERGFVIENDLPNVLVFSINWHEIYIKSLKFSSVIMPH